MASCSRAVRKQYRRREGLNRERDHKIQPAVTKWSLKISPEWQNDRKNNNSAIEPCTFTTGKSAMQRLDTDMANIWRLSQWTFGWLNLPNCAQTMMPRYPLLHSILCGIRRFLEDALSDMPLPDYCTYGKDQHLTTVLIILFKSRLN